ncbi:transposase [Clostridium sp. MSJ-4]|uniref:Transposase n=1 Tax=Clostridium simiarum TaxID=2841506 RepID=A0ABS6EYP8_9CLOT|nr:transposase [Clostridium simiarum]
MVQAVKRIEKTGEPVSKVASELGIKATTMQGWVKKYKQSLQAPFPGSGHFNPKETAGTMLLRNPFWGR